VALWPCSSTTSTWSAARGRGEGEAPGVRGFLLPQLASRISCAARRAFLRRSRCVSWCRSTRSFAAITPRRTVQDRNDRTRREAKAGAGRLRALPQGEPSLPTAGAPGSLPRLIHRAPGSCAQPQTVVAIQATGGSLSLFVVAPSESRRLSWGCGGDRVFGARMALELVNDGPVTIELEI
jgi:hypothetical protein